MPTYHLVIRKKDTRVKSLIAAKRGGGLIGAKAGFISEKTVFPAREVELSFCLFDCQTGLFSGAVHIDMYELSYCL